MWLFATCELPEEVVDSDCQLPMFLQGNTGQVGVTAHSMFPSYETLFVGFLRYVSLIPDTCRSIRRAINNTQAQDINICLGLIVTARAKGT